MLGDVIDRGPDSRDAIGQLIALRERCRLVCLQGNHEQMMLDALDGKMPIQEWLVHGGAETLDSYGKGAGMNALDPTHVDFIRTWGDVYESDSHFFAHGNYLATRPLDRQPWRDLRWQSLKWHTPEPHISGKTAVLGHTSNKQGEILNLGHLICIDTYCHGGCGSQRSTQRVVASGKRTKLGSFVASNFRRSRMKPRCGNTHNHFADDFSSSGHPSVLAATSQTGCTSAPREARDRRVVYRPARSAV
jgi:serine/threonine protein phosphatase 1